MHDIEQSLHAAEAQYICSQGYEQYMTLTCDILMQAYRYTVSANSMNILMDGH